jgi:flavin reductase (DIM6/NTAB) family NADH-FMN oxidoreductase RutF
MKPELTFEHDHRHAFLQAMRCVAANVFIASAGVGSERVGMTVTAAMSLSASPPSMLLCINADSRCHDALCNSSSFTLNALSEIDRAVAAWFATMPLERRFECGDWRNGPNDTPFLDTAIASFACERIDVQRTFTHSLIIGRVVETVTRSGRPLTYHDGSYSGIHALEREAS